MTDYIPFAIQGEIMKRLPTKSLLRFRSVSKSWRSLIDSSNFITDYSLNHTHQHHLLLNYLISEFSQQKCVSLVDDDDTFPLEKVSLSLPAPAQLEPVIVGSSRGLFCFHFLTGRSKRNIVLWNPAIRKSVAIDVPVAAPLSSLVPGFGVCPHTRDPKIVTINYSRQYDLLSVKVYTLSSGAWRSIPTASHPRKSVDLLMAEQRIVIDEFICWLAIDGDVNTSMRTPKFQGYNVIVLFDLTLEKFIQVSLPVNLSRANNNDVVISKLKDSLVVLQVVTEAAKKVYDVWMMERGVSNTFTKLFTINSPDASIHGVLGFRKNKEPIFDMISYGELAVQMGKYDSVHQLDSEPYLVDGRIEGFFIHQLHSEHINCVLIGGNGMSLSAHYYMETLLLLDH